MFVKNKLCNYTTARDRNKTILNNKTLGYN